MPVTLDRFQSIDPALLDIGPSDRVIDLGCGTGRHVLELSKIKSDMIGADVSRNDIRAGRYLLEIMRRRGEVKARVKREVIEGAAVRAHTGLVVTINERRTSGRMLR